MKKIGVTGGIGSGKSFVTQAFAQLGVPVFDSDQAAKTLMEKDASLRAAIIRLLGPQAYVGEVLQKSWVASAIFADPELRHQIAKEVHPRVYEAFDVWLKQQNAPYILFESALLLEGGRADDFDLIWVVEAPLSLRLSRLEARGLKREEALQRINAQWTDDERRVYADLIWVNDESSDIMLKIFDIHSKLTK